MRRRGNLPLDRLFMVEEYPTDLMGFYGQGYSISRFLIEMGGRPRFLQFVRDGEKKGMGCLRPVELWSGQRPRTGPSLAVLAPDCLRRVVTWLATIPPSPTAGS